MNRDRFPISEKEVRNRASTGKRLSVINPATGKQLAAVPNVDRALLNKAISDARNAFSGWGAVPFGRRKAILANLLNKIEDHADELSALLTAEQGGHLAQAWWEIDRPQTRSRHATPDASQCIYHPRRYTGHDRRTSRHGSRGSVSLPAPDCRAARFYHSSGCILTI
jgi:acyl-CoA reductase-like NAD-dependent aldehyde dehydrogenase